VKGVRVMGALELFPLRVAKGKRFCNRELEKKFLKDCIEQKKPTVLISPRRYGKTSLANKVVDDLKRPFCSVDFLTTYDDLSICHSIVKGVSELISQIMPINMKTVSLIEKCFRGVKAAIRYKSIELEFSAPLEKIDPIQQVLETLNGLEKLGEKLNKSVVIFIDEFQRILETPKGDAIQGMIRHVAQSTAHIAFLFSGSSRHMLSQIFDDSNMPLYMMCEKFYLGRIASPHYMHYIQEAALIKWKTKISENIIERILKLTENHPFYVNYLCNQLWQKSTLPTEEGEVDTAWEECFLSEERRFVTELEQLTINQRLLLKEVANTPNLLEPTSTTFLSKIALSSGTVIPILKTLSNKDLIFIDDQKVTRVLDPLLKYMLIKGI